ncbi:wall-associated receptor kinase 2-like [Triticum dicoccoides]|uniref:wall-associated receptor kinase 2-like n=1 Tax=Triticum dicoccoides TaxID=85692 RepID=UPI0018914ED2|nr:wall-associated receptor kinase 2-like [Triticum dicoccoides]
MARSDQALLALQVVLTIVGLAVAAGIRTYQHAANLSGTPFSFSEDDNKFFVIGCNTVAYVIQDDSSVRGCISRCLPEERLNNGSCSGYGCCRTEIRRNMSSYKVFLKESYNSTEELRYRSRCSYVMVMEEAALDYSTTYIDSMKFYDTRKGQVPAVMDWAIGGYACKAARLNGTSYACVGRNTECVDTSVGQGYLCNCSSGYEGNPYTISMSDSMLRNILAQGFAKTGQGVTPAHVHREKYWHTCLLVVGSHIAGLLQQGQSGLKLKARKGRNLKEKNFKKNHGLLLQQLVDKDISEKMLFSLDELEKATNNFDETRKIGRGGHGTGPQALSWRDRLNIAVAVANALTYLHSSSSISIVHRDIKTDNILLDDCLTPKVSDFGTSRQIPIDKTGVTTGVQGTFGYLDLEYYHTHRLTEKLDVYSFGAVLVELPTRKKPFLFLSSVQIGLVSHFNSLITLDKVCEILDPQVMLEAGKDAETVTGLAATCLAQKGDERPTMRQLETRLRELLATRRNNNINNKNVSEQNNVSRELFAA